MILHKNIQIFKEHGHEKYKQLFEDLVEFGQQPHTLFITCSDSRVNPNLVTNTQPGEMFVIRNVGNMVPKYHEKKGEHSTLAAIEYAVLTLNVSNIIVCGHTHCGACEALWEPEKSGFHTRHWLQLGMSGRSFIEMFKDNLEDKKFKFFITEQLNIIVQLKRLASYPFIKERLENHTLTLEGWHYILERGEILIFDPSTHEFKPAQEVIRHPRCNLP